MASKEDDLYQLYMLGQIDEENYQEELAKLRASEGPPSEPAQLEKPEMPPESPVETPSMTIETAQWHVAINGVQKGPFTKAVLAAMVEGNELTRQTLIWKSGMANWTAAGTVSELEDIFPVYNHEEDMMDDSFKVIDDNEDIKAKIEFTNQRYELDEESDEDDSFTDLTDEKNEDNKYIGIEDAVFEPAFTVKPVSKEEYAEVMKAIGLQDEDSISDIAEQSSTINNTNNEQNKIKQFINIVNEIKESYNDESWENIYKEPISEKILKNVRKALKIPENEKVLIVFDDTLFKSAKDALVFTDWGIHYKIVEKWTISWKILYSNKFKLDTNGKNPVIQTWDKISQKYGNEKVIKLYVMTKPANSALTAMINAGAYILGNPNISNIHTFDNLLEYVKGNS